MAKRTISHYEIIDRLGAGGMGEVYRARDSRIGRDVAIKVLPAALADDADYVARFRREAQILGSLNHPNIAAIYGLEENAIVMELVEGKTLSARLTSGRLPVELVVRYGLEIAAALAAAHARGVIHRDLKPGNIMVTKSGVKVLDFGLAKRMQTDETLTAADVVMGTPGYMAPEQLEGRPCDTRTDIFALGLILYEMATGKRPQRDTMPPMESLPAPLARIIENCLAADPDSRWRSAADVGIALGWPLTDGSDVRRAKHWSPWRTAVAITLLTALAFAAWHYRPRTAETHAVALHLNPPPGLEFNSPDSAISSDGQMLAFVTQGRVSKLWVRAIDSLAARELPGSEGASLPFWSHNNASLGFFAGGKLKRIDLAGDRVATLADVPAGRGGTWNDADVILFSRATNGPIWRVSAAGGVPEPATTLDASREASHRFPFFLPDGRRFIFFVRAEEPGVRGVYVASLDNNREKTRIVQTRFSGVYSSAHAGVKAGALLWMNEDGSLVAQSFDLQSATVSGATVLVPSVPLMSRGYDGQTPLSSSHNGTLVYGHTERRSQLTWYNRTGEVTGTVGETDSYFTNDLRISPDGTLAAVIRANQPPQIGNVWTLHLGSGASTRVTVAGAASSLAWSPDARQIVYGGGGPYTGARATLHGIGSGGGGTPERLTNTPHSQGPCDWSPDGKVLLYTQTSAEAGLDIWALPFTGDRKPVPYLQTPFQEFAPRFSPNGGWFSYTSDESGRQEVYVRSFPTNTTKQQVSLNGGSAAQWSRDGSELFYRSPDGNLMAVSIKASSGTLRFGPPQTLFPLPAGAYDVAHDGRHFLVFLPRRRQDVSPLTVILNWQDKLAKSR